MMRRAMSMCGILLALMAGVTRAADPYRLVWDTPSKDSSGSMPLGNGDIGINLWVEKGGDLFFYISKTDAWDENARLVKLGRVRVRIAPNPFAADQPFQQVLDLKTGRIVIRAGQGDSAVSLAVWVDANRPVILVEAEGRRAFDLTASVELWRTRERTLTGPEVYSAYGMDGGPQPVVVRTDTRLPARDHRLTWYHRNPASIWPGTMKLQGMEAWMSTAKDPLLNRTFGGQMRGEGLVAENDSTLRSAAARTRRVVSVYLLTAQTATGDEWVQQLSGVVSRADAVAPEQAKAAHENWWRQFWDRSYIHVSGGTQGEPISTNELPLRIGADSDGQNGFAGRIRHARVFNRVLTDEQIAALADGKQIGLPNSPEVVGYWRFAQPQKGVFANLGPAPMPAVIRGQVTVQGDSEDRSAVLNGQGWIEVAHKPALNLAQGCMLEAWICPGKQAEGGGRIIDKSKATTSNGYLLDTFPGNSLRFICQAGTLSHDARLPVGRWSHVVGAYDATTGELKLFVNGRRVASRQVGASLDQVTQAYALQRFVGACAGRGAYPIKFNGSIFTVDSRERDECYDADYRRWGGPYWFQNTRLPYWPMLAAGDFDTMLPLFRMYSDILPMARERTRVYFKHEGAFFPETLYFWGAYANSNYGWDRKGKPASHVDNTYIRWYFEGGLELLSMIREHYAFTKDASVVRTTLLPLADAIIEFYDLHYPRNERGQFVFKPAQALETWQNVINPLPTIAGLRYVLDGLLSLPQDLADDARRQTWQRLRAALPDLPMRKVDGQTVISSAEKILGPVSNSENPELYAVYPYRLFGVGKPDLELGRRTFNHRRVRGHVGWQQDDTQAAFLGLSKEASEYVSRRLTTWHSGSRFPAFWGPNFDWVPDQDHGGNGLMALQTMLIQSDEKGTIRLLPAWPRSWDVSFKLHAAQATVVECSYRAGKIESLRVTPPERRSAVVVVDGASPQKP